MINAILVNDYDSRLAYLKQSLLNNCPEIRFCGISTSLTEAQCLIKEVNPHLVFVEKRRCIKECLHLLSEISSLQLEVILISDQLEFTLEAINYRVGGYLLKPIDCNKLKKAVKKAALRIRKTVSTKRNNTTNIPFLVTGTIGIPTLDGLEYVPVQQIIRCEGLQKYTRVVVEGTKDIISSYNIGVFRKKLSDLGFFSPHKSHLINLSKVRRYRKEGTITLIDQSSVPVARRRKCDFLNQIPQL